MKFIKNCSERSANLERRRFLDMIGRTGVSTALLKASPFAAGVFASRFAQAAGNDKHAIFMYLPNGAPNGLWMPKSATEMNISTRAFAEERVSKGSHQGKLASEFCEFREVNMGSGGHGNTHKSMGTYSDNSDTLDTVLAEENFPTSIYKVLRAGVQVGGGPSFCKEAGQQATHPKLSATEFYKTIFTGTPPTANQDDSYKRVMEINRKALDAIQKKLGVDEYERFDTHLASLNEIERALDAQNQPQDVSDECKTPTIADSASGHIVDDGKAISDIVVAALKCGLTNVATIMVSDDQAGWLAGDRGPAFGLRDSGLNHHNYSHSGNDTNTANMVSLITEIPAYLVRRLAEENGPDGTSLIDSTVFVQVTDMGDGDHGLADAPFIAASNMSGFGYSTGGGNHQTFMGDLPSRMGLAGSLRT